MEETFCPYFAAAHEVRLCFPPSDQRERWLSRNCNCRNRREGAIFLFDLFFRSKVRRNVFRFHKVFKLLVHLQYVSHLTACGGSILLFQMYAKHFVDAEGKVWQGGRGNPPVDAPHLVGTTPEIESLRPKSPPPRAQQQPPSQAANSIPQTAGGITTNKKPPSTSQVGSQNGPSATNLVSGQGHGLHSQASSVGGTSRGGGGHAQPTKRQNAAVQGSKPYLITASGIESVAVSVEPSSGPELVEVSGEREGGGIGGDQSKTLSS